MTVDAINDCWIICHTTILEYNFVNNVMGEFMTRCAPSSNTCSVSTSVKANNNRVNSGCAHPPGAPYMLSIAAEALSLAMRGRGKTRQNSFRESANVPYGSYCLVTL
jgi:hypothetical protein